MIRRGSQQNRALQLRAGNGRARKLHLNKNTHLHDAALARLELLLALGRGRLRRRAQLLHLLLAAVEARMPLGHDALALLEAARRLLARVAHPAAELLALGVERIKALLRARVLRRRRVGRAPRRVGVGGDALARRLEVARARRQRLVGRAQPRVLRVQVAPPALERRLLRVDAGLPLAQTRLLAAEQLVELRREPRAVVAELGLARRERVRLDALRARPRLAVVRDLRRDGVALARERRDLGAEGVPAAAQAADLLVAGLERLLRGGLGLLGLRLRGAARGGEALDVLLGGGDLVLGFWSARACVCVGR